MGQLLAFGAATMVGVEAWGRRWVESSNDPVLKANMEFSDWLSNTLRGALGLGPVTHPQKPGP